MTLLDFIVHHPAEAILLLLAIVAAFAAVVFIFMFATRRRTVTIGKDGLSVEAVAAEAVQKNVDQYIQLAVLYDDQRDEINRKLWTLEQNDAMARYMNLVDERVAVACKRFKEVHEQLIAQKIGERGDVSWHPDVRRYGYMIRNIENDLRDRFRTAMRRNGFVSKSMDELRQYATTKLEAFFAAVATIIDTDYQSDILPIGELRAAQAAHKAEYGAIMLDIFLQAKSISRQVAAEVERLKAARKYMQTVFLHEKRIVTADEAVAKCNSSEGCEF